MALYTDYTPLYTFRPPAQLNNADGDNKRRWHRIVIALGGPLTHIPHMALYAGLLTWYCNGDTALYQTCPYNPANPLSTSAFWSMFCFFDSILCL